MQRKKGFTLIEILISIAIIAILTAIGIVSYNSVSKRSRDAKRMGDIEQLRSALEMYRSDNGKYPAVNTSGFDNASNLNDELVLNGGYLPAIPTDPKASQYPYKYTTMSQDAVTGNYYGYCLAAHIETSAPAPNCGIMMPTDFNYGVRQP